MLDKDRLVSGNDVFFAATGVTDGELLDGVTYIGNQAARTESVSMRSRSGTVRRISARHDRAEAARDHRRAAGVIAASATARSAPTRDGSSSRLASERRNAWVTITWIRSCVCS